MSFNDLELSFIPAGINWFAENVDPETHQVTLKGTFQTAEGRTFEVSVSYNKDLLSQQVESRNATQMSNKIKNALNEIEVDTLASLSGHTLRTNFEELQRKTIHVLGPDNQELANWQASPQLFNAISRIQTVFNRVFEFEEMDFEEEKREVGITFTEYVPTPKEYLIHKLPGKILENEETRQRLRNIEYLLEREYGSRDKINEFYEALAERIHKSVYKPGTSEERTTYNVIPMYKEAGGISFSKFLEHVETSLLKKGSFILDTFVDNSLDLIVSSAENTDTAFVDTSRYRVGPEGNAVVPGELDLHFGSARVAEKILIPVNVNNGHWILYCFDGTNLEAPVLYRCDSRPTFTDHHRKKLEKLETQIIDDLHRAFHLKPETSIRVSAATVTQQVNNDCGAHVFKNAEWFVRCGDFNPDKLKPEEFSRFRLDMLFAAIK